MKEQLSNIGLISGSFLASLCCIGPLILAALGLGGAGIVAGLESYRPYFMGFTFLSLGFGFYMNYRKKEVECEDGSCKVETGSKNSKIMLWSMTGLAIILMAFPYINWGDDNFDFTNVSPEYSVVTIPVKGMSCSSCNKAVELAVGKLKGIRKVSADHEKGEAIVAFRKDKISIANIVESINKLGYNAKIIN